MSDADPEIGAGEDPYGDSRSSILAGSQPEPAAETARKTGLAFSAGVALFSPVMVFLLLGWGADVLFRISPWGIVLGIILGAILGFAQFFRITSQIFRK